MHKKNILIVDDSELNRNIIYDILKDDYEITEASNGVEAVDYIYKNLDKLVLIILDIMMPQLNGIEVMKIIKSDTRTADIPVIMITAADSNEEYCLRLGAVDFIKKPFNSNIVSSRVNTHINKKPYYPINENISKTDVCFMMFSTILYKLLAIKDLQKPSTTESIKKCCNLSRIFAAEVWQKIGGEYELLEKHTDRFADLVPLRDVGKFMINDNILSKKGPLTAEEFSEIMKHGEYGLQLIQPFSENQEASIYRSMLIDIISDHHENFNGTGYPIGKKSSAISPLGRLTAILDCYLAMTEERCYRPAHSHEETIEYIKSEKNKKFDGRLVDIFVNLPIGKYQTDTD